MNFENEIADRLNLVADNADLNSAANTFMNKSLYSMYSYNYSWMGRPIIQYPQDMIAMQELIWLSKT